MHRILLFIPVFLILWNGVVAGTVTKVYYFDKPEVQKVAGYDLILFKDCRQFGETGKATLPFFAVRILLPPGEIAGSIEINYESECTLPGNYQLLPRQEARPVSEGETGTLTIDSDFYNSSTPYPSRYKAEINNQFLNGYGILLSAFTPVRWTPSSGRLSYFTRVTVTISTIPDPSAGERSFMYDPSLSNLEKIRQFIQNPGLMASYPPSRAGRTGEYDYLVITGDQYKAEFDTLAGFYEPRGIMTKIVAVEHIDSTVSGQDLQEKIRNYIIGEYTGHGIRYAMLGGDAEVVPYRGFYCYVVSGAGYSDDNIPSDLYYSALDGSWNTDGDTNWGEPGEDDLLPEVAVGRLTFSDTAELHNMIHKSIMYQGNPVEGELTHPLLAGEHLWNNPLTYGSDYMRLLVGLRSDNGYTTQGIPPEQPIDSLYDDFQAWDKYDMINKINSGKPWVHHCGHASNGYVMKLSNTDITNANFSQANGTSHNYPVVYTHGCNCGGFDNTDCIAERMIGIDHFAVAFVGNSRFGWFVEGTTDGPSQHLHREFMDAIYRDSLYHIGMAHLKSKMETAPFVDLPLEYEPGATRWCFYDNNVLGDPMLAVWTREPHEVSAIYQALIPIGRDSLIVQLSGQAGIFKGFNCTVIRNDTVFGTAITDSTGSATILFDGPMAEGVASLVIAGYNILPQSFPLEAVNYWLGLTTDWNDPNNWYDGNVPGVSSDLVIPANPYGNYFPLENTGPPRQCSSILIEEGAHFMIRKDETFSIYGN